LKPTSLGGCNKLLARQICKAIGGKILLPTNYLGLQKETKGRAPPNSKTGYTLAYFSH